MDVVNIFGDDWDDRRERPGWLWNRLSVGRRLGAKQIGASVYELEPGQKTFPYHYQYAEEEWLIVLHGEPTLRVPDGEHRLSAGDAVVFPTGPDGAHAIRNETDEPVRLLMLSTNSEAEIAVYPDSGKLGVFGPGLRKLLRADAEVDYFEGED